MRSFCLSNLVALKVDLFEFYFLYSFEGLLFCSHALFLVLGETSAQQQPACYCWAGKSWLNTVEWYVAEHLP